MRRFWIVFGLVAVFVVVAIMIAGVLLRSLDLRGPAVAGVLHWDVSGAYPEDRDDSPLAILTHGQGPRTWEVAAALRRAAEDPRISGLAIEIHSFPADWAQVEELSDAVAAFTATGKPSVAWIESGGNREYSLALAANRVVVPPEGILSVIGVSAELSFLKGTLGKLGMEADYLHVGRYKSAPETYMRDEPTDPNREMITALVDARYESLLDRIATRRGVTPERAASWIDRGLFDAGAALAEGLVDTVFYASETRDRTTEMEDYLRSSGRAALGAGPRVAVIPVSGVITGGESRRDPWQGRIAGSATIVDRIREAADDPGIDAIILRVDSPGGSALDSDFIWREASEAREVVPVVVSMAGTAASGGYYVSCAADSIFAQPGTLTGSIGVYMGKIDRHAFYDKIGISRRFITRGENALMFSDAARFTDGQRVLLQRHLDEFYDRFVGLVADQRRLDPAAVDEVARGRVWTGADAVERGLVDGLGGFDRALASVRSLLGLAPDSRLRLVTYERELSLLERIVQRMISSASGSAPAVVSLDGAMARLRDEGWIAAVALLDGRTLAMMPFRVDLR